MLEIEKPAFDAYAYLASAGLGRRIVILSRNQAFFSQGEAADSVFYLQSGRAKLTVVSKNGMEATITRVAVGEFVGEESLASQGALHSSTATSITDCAALKIESEEMLRAMREEQSLSEIFIKYLLARAVRIQSDLVDQLFNSVEKRLARILLLMAKFGEPDGFEALIPVITEDSLAKMIGTQRSRVSFFMNRFRELGLIDYDGRIRVHKALLNVVLHDQMPGDNAAKPPIKYTPQMQ
jgi:CRP/FNR family cyclic AMP-dependent transcriptional regulator